jgi:hypothetical protein
MRRWDRGKATEKTSRNLKAVASIVIAVKLFDVPIENLSVLNVNLPGSMFDVTSLAIMGYMMITLSMYWHVDYLSWRDGPILSAKASMDLLLSLVHKYIRTAWRSMESMTTN